MARTTGTTIGGGFDVSPSNRGYSMSNYSTARAPRIAGGLGQISQILTGLGDARKSGQQAGYDTMANAYNIGLEDTKNRYDQYQDRNKTLYDNMMKRPNLFRNNQQENTKLGMLGSYLGSYNNPNISRLAAFLPNKDQLNQRQLEDLRMLSFADSTYLPTDMFNEFYGKEGQSNLGIELGLPQNGFMQSGVSGARGNNARYNTEFDDYLTNSSKIANQIQNELAKKAHSLSSMSGLQRFGAGMGLGAAILGMANPFSLG